MLLVILQFGKCHSKLEISLNAIINWSPHKIKRFNDGNDGGFQIVEAIDDTPDESLTDYVVQIMLPTYPIKHGKLPKTRTKTGEMKSVFSLLS